MLLHNISAIKQQNNLNAINPNQHTVNATISPLRNKYPAINEYSTLDLGSQTNMAVLGKYASIFEKIDRACNIAHFAAILGLPISRLLML